MTEMANDERGTMSSFLQHRSHARHGPMRPLFVGALTCGALLATAPGAVANHMVMADGTMCPHAAGTPVAGEAAPTPGPERSASTAPIAVSSTAKSAPGTPARPATKPASQAPSKGAAQTQAQRPATTQAQAQRPAAATAPARRLAAVTEPAARATTARTPAQADGASGTTRQTPVARTRGTSPKRSLAARSAASRLTGKPVARTVALQRAAAVDRPVAAIPDTTKADDGGSSATLFGLFGLLGVSLIGAFTVLIGRRVKRGAVPAVPVMTPADAQDAAIEAELQAMIVETKARAPHVADGLDDAGQERRISIPG